METQHKSLERVKDIADIVLTELSEITGETLDSFDLKFEISDTADKDQVAAKIRDLVKEVNKNGDWKDKVEDYTPGKLLRKLQGKLAKHLLGRAPLGYLGEGLIAVNPKILKRSDKSLKWMLSHEEQHVLDDQQYNIFERRYDFFKKWAGLAKPYLEKRHEAGIIKGYIKPTEEIKKLKNEMDECLEEGNRFMAILESHAMFIQKKYVEHTKMSPTDYLSLGMVLKSLAQSPLILLSKQMRKKVAQYSKGEKIVGLAYKKDIDIGTLYKHVPTCEELENPEKYFEHLEVREKEF